MGWMSEAEVEAFARDGAAVVRGAFAEWTGVIAEGIARNMADPGPHASENAVTEGRFFDDYCNWQRIPEFERMLKHSPAADIAGEAMRSPLVQAFHDHVLVKEPGTPKPTPWHQDGPYYLVEGRQTVSLWIPVDPVREAALRFIAGSHLWTRKVRPVSWADDADFYATGDWRDVPQPEAEGLTVLEWPLEPGDAVLFHFDTVHGARGNVAAGRRRALSLRYVGEDARVVARPGRTSPPFPGHGMAPGDRLREDWFPVVRGR
jgi:ectoine hydroxylase-related dioxygenase (phytanoyl-CoA dioxygenase family)